MTTLYVYSGNDPLPSPVALHKRGEDLLVRFTSWSHTTVIFPGSRRVDGRFWVSGGSRLPDPVDGDGIAIKLRGGLAIGAYIKPEDLPTIAWWARVPNHDRLHLPESR